PRDRPHSAITVGITKLYICTSNASSAHPPKQAPMVRRSLGFNSANQPSIALLPYSVSSSWRSWLRRYVSRFRQPHYRRTRRDGMRNGVQGGQSDLRPKDCSSRGTVGIFYTWS